MVNSIENPFAVNKVERGGKNIYVYTAVQDNWTT